MRYVVSIWLAITVMLCVNAYAIVAVSEKEPVADETAVDVETKAQHPESPRRESPDTASRKRRSDDGPRIVTVSHGDSLADIAKEVEVTPCDIEEANIAVEDPDVISPGQQLKIPEEFSGRPCPEPTPEQAARPESTIEFGPETQPEPTQHEARSASAGVWDRLARCESGGNWSTNTGNGFYGGLQFHPDTWTRYGGRNFAPNAHQASREQEIVIAERVLANEGWGAWPACSSELGLR